MAQKYCAAHIKTMLEAAAIDAQARRPWPTAKSPAKRAPRLSAHRPEGAGA